MYTGITVVSDASTTSYLDKQNNERKKVLEVVIWILKEPTKGILNFF